MVRLQCLDLTSTILLIATTIAMGQNITDDRPLYKDWKPFSTRLKQHPIIDMTEGGLLHMHIAVVNQSWGASDLRGLQYGFGRAGSHITSPGPIILAKRNVPFVVKWRNRLGPGPHLLDPNVEPSLIEDTYSRPYGKKGHDGKASGIPVVTHIHGMENPPEYDGLPYKSVTNDEIFTAVYKNTQPPATKTYHDHAMGISRLNMWAGLVGTYIVQDPELDAKYNLNGMPDYVLTLSDKLISSTGQLLYPTTAPCVPIDPTKWVPEAFGTVNTVNGIVMPYVNLEARQVRLRWSNVANARVYDLDLTKFGDKCQIIAKDGGYVTTPVGIESLAGKKNILELYPLERVEMVCDFSDVEEGTQFNITTSIAEWSSYKDFEDTRVMQIRIVPSSECDEDTKVTLPEHLTEYKDLKKLFHETKGMTRTIVMGEIDDKNKCPTRLYLEKFIYGLKPSAITAALHCTQGKVEKWIFNNTRNVTHPFHWHLITAQCGPTESTINTNELKDVMPIPYTGTNVSRVCYVACTPEDFLIKGSKHKADDFGVVVTKDPYLAHCHIMEHDENKMMAKFYITVQDTPN